MPFSTPIFKQETFDFLTNKFGPSTTILDLGAGCGTYSDLLKSKFTNMDAVEIHQPYIDQYDLKNKYNNVYNENALNFEFDYYDIIILGDILEHIDEREGIELIEKLYKKCNELIIGIPFNSEQGVHFDNIYEIHLQAELTNESFLEKYKGFRPLALRYDYGIYIKNNKSTNNIKQ
jgi:tRNA1(Val) A37 N6-methylase TrmN6